ncbi:16S rRNA (guanine(527)-N(7))-methyltransferase RsmG [Candidatus Phytoplasma oryzae]|nr:16S rRNA (guanine(527)-N(7))-methyltransferase RsmG [Candidatus Phytoplasma oryzae]
MFFNYLLKKKFNLNNLQLIQLKKYYYFLKIYNKKINLTSLLSEQNVYIKHFYDSFLISKIISLQKKTKICDLGTGAGFPGIPIKILYPHLQVCLLESNKKKIIFLNELISILKLSNVFIFNHKIEKHEKKYNLVITRALGNLNVIFKLSSFVLNKKGYLIAMKGPKYEIEMKKIEKTNSFILKNKKISELPFNLGQRVNLLFQKIK